MKGFFYRDKSKLNAAYISNDVHITIWNRNPQFFVKDQISGIYSYAPLTRSQAAQILKAWRKNLECKRLMPKGK